MNAYEKGYNAAEKGEFRAAPSTIKILTDEHKAWYAGFDAATENNKNKTLTAAYKVR